MEAINEKLLNAWLRVSFAINSERVVSDMPYNESVVCNILYRNTKEGKLTTATELCARTKILKSQMNRTLNNLEEMDIITRERSKEDKRQVYVMFNMNKADVYIKQHTKILKIVDMFVEKFGEEKAIDIINMFESISNMADEVM